MKNPDRRPAAEEVASGTETVFAILLAISSTHLLNDTVQSLIPALYPLVKQSFSLSFAQVGLITLTFQLTASLLQPGVGLATDRRPQPYLLVVGMGFSLAGLLLLAFAPSFGLVLAAVALTGSGSAVFHPESSRVAYLAAGRRRGLAQCIFQVGGNAGSSLGPLLAALIIGARTRGRLVWFALLPLLLPHVGLAWTTALSILIGLILSSAFSAILVYAQELIPGKVGMISGLFFGFAFGMGGIGSAVLGRLADQTSIAFVYRLCSFLPLLGLITGLLPNLERKKA